jgi:hypothetical protein
MTHRKDDPALKCKNQCAGGFIPGHGRNKRHRRQLKSGCDVERSIIDQRARLMQGHDVGGEPMPDVIVGSGGLYSSVNDILTWLEWRLDRFSERDARSALSTIRQRCGALAQSMPSVPPLFVGNAANESLKKGELGHRAGHVLRRHVQHNDYAVPAGLAAHHQREKTRVKTGMCEVAALVKPESSTRSNETIHVVPFRIKIPFRDVGRLHCSKSSVIESAADEK